MVCSQCQAKLSKVITPDPWKSGARNTTESGQRKVNENKALSGKKSRPSPYTTPYTTAFKKCRLCNQKVHQQASFYCQDCAYKKSICSMCGKKLMSTAKYNQSSV